MSKRLLLLVLTMFVLLALSCSELERPAPLAPAGNEAASTVDTEGLAWAFVSQAGWEAAVARDPAKAIPSDGGEALLWNFNREVIAGNIVHYSAIVRTGPGPYDQIGIHRVVKESRPFRPIHTRKALFLQHGASMGFLGVFAPGLLTSHIPRDFGIAPYLAERNLDVWGITQSWYLVPAEETNFDFMADWGIPHDVQNLEVAVAIARLSRWITGDGLDKMLLLGYSYGAQLGYALLDGEAQRSPACRQIRGFVPMDMAVKTDVEEYQQFFCDYGEYAQAGYAAGQYNDDAYFRPIGLLARDQPDEESPHIPGFTNLQVALYFGAAVGFPPTVHFLAGEWDGEIPTGLQYVSVPAWIDFLCAASPHEAMRVSVDQCLQICDDAVPWDDHLAEVTVPVFYIGARGGMGDLGLVTLDFLGSSDVTSLIVSTHPPEEVLIDFAHIDMSLGYNAPELVWEPIRAWVVAHSPAGREPVAAIAAAEE